MLTPADWFILAIVLISGGLSLFRGFLTEVISLVAWAAAFIVSSKFYERFALKLDGWFDNEMTRKVVACVSLFIMTLLIIGLCGKIIRSLVHTVGLSSTDRLLGMVFGILRAVVVLCVMLVVLQMGFRAKVFNAMENEPFYRDSLFIPELERIVSWFFTYNEQNGSLDIGINMPQQNGYQNYQQSNSYNSQDFQELGNQIKQGVNSVVDQGISKVQEFSQNLPKDTDRLFNNAQQALDKVDQYQQGLRQDLSSKYNELEDELLNSTQGTIDLNSL